MGQVHARRVQGIARHKVFHMAQYLCFVLGKSPRTVRNHHQLQDSVGLKSHT